MQTSRMWSLSPKTLPQVHKVHLCHKSNHTLSRKPTKQGSFYVTATSGDLESTRPLVQFTPTFLGDHFFSVPVYDSVSTKTRSQ